MTRMRYAVVHFFERNEVEIIETRHIITGENCDREDMNGDDWDANTEVQVPWPLNKSRKQQKYVAKILRFGWLPEMLKLMEELTDKEKRKQFAKGADSKGSEEWPALSALQTPTPATCTTSTPSRSPALQTASLKSPQSKPSSPIPSALTPIHGHLRKVLGYDVNNDGQVDLGYGVYVSAHNLQYVSKADPKKTTYMTCEVVFTREELASSSMTGKKSNAFKDSTEKPQLDKNKTLSNESIFHAKTARSGR